MKKIIALCIIVLTIVSLCACGKNDDSIKIETNAGNVSAADWNNWEKYEYDVIKKIKLDKEILNNIEKEVNDYKSGKMTEENIRKIDSEYGNIEKYKEYLEINAKKVKTIEDATKDVVVTDKDRETFISKYSKAFAGKNAVVLQFSNNELAVNYVEQHRYNGREGVLQFVKELSGSEDVTWERINELSEKTGVSLLHNGDSNKYNYCLDATLAGVFDNMVDGQTSEPFVFGDKSTIMIRVSDGCIERDDALVDNYMLKIKKEEAYRKYIIDNK